MDGRPRRPGREPAQPQLAGLEDGEVSADESLPHILTAQGPDAPDGAYDYLAHGRMIGGFALVAFPAQYGVSGVITFMVNYDGIVYQKDLGPNTATIARAMKHFNPDASWKKV